MEKLIKSIEGVHPGKYDLRRNELSAFLMGGSSNPEFIAYN